VLGTYRDVTERKRVAEDLEASRNLLRNLLEAIPIPVFYKDAEGVYLDCNAALLQFIGRSREEIVGRKVPDVWPAELADIYRTMDQRLFRGEDRGVQVYRSVMPHADGTLHPVEFHKAVFPGPHGNSGGLVAAMLDISAAGALTEEKLNAGPE